MISVSKNTSMNQQEVPMQKYCLIILLLIALLSLNAELFAKIDNPFDSVSKNTQFYQYGTSPNFPMDDGYVDPSDPGYDPSLYCTQLDAAIYTTAVWENILYAAGYFQWYDGETPMVGVAYYNSDGNTWVQAGQGLSGTVQAITPHNGTLCAGGNLGDPAGRWTGPVACLSNGQWEPVEGLFGVVYDFTPYNNQLCATGDFTGNEGQIRNVSCHNGAGWEPLSSGFRGTARAITTSNGILYAGGWIGQSGDAWINSIAYWDGSNWQQVGTGLNGPVFTLAPYNGGILAGGSFTRSGSTDVNRIAYWDGKQWNQMGGGLDNGTVQAIAVQNDRVFAGGMNVQNIGSESAHVGVWYYDEDGGTWEPAGGSFNSEFYTLDFYNDELIAGGWFFDIENGIQNVASFDGDSWNPLGERKLGGLGMNSSVYSMYNHDEYLYVGGAFTLAGDERARRIVRWDGEKWEPVGEGFNSNVWSIIEYNDELIAGGFFTHSGETTLNRIARRDGEGWQPMGEGFDGWVVTLAEFNNSLIAGGNFFYSGAVRVDRIARWDGEDWSPMGEGFNGGVRAFILYNDELIAGGGFTESGGTTLNRIARWNGEEWQPMGEGFDGWVEALYIHNGELIAGGDFTHSGTTSINRIARWDGENWQPVGEGLNGRVRTLIEYNDELFAAGDFTTSGETSVNRLARWDGEKWHRIGSGLSASVYDLAVYQESLYIGGSFQTAGGKASARFTRWHPDPVSVDDGFTAQPESYTLFQNYPNPFNPATVIGYRLPVGGFVRITVHDMLGREIATLTDEYKPAGIHEVEFHAAEFSSGVYIYRLQAGEYVESRKLLLLR
jgi:hypothetical protein